MSKLYIYNGNNREELNISEDTEEEFNDIETDFEDEIEDIMNSMLNDCDLLIQLYTDSYNSQLDIYRKNIVTTEMSEVMATVGALQAISAFITAYMLKRSDISDEEIYIKDEITGISPSDLLSAIFAFNVWFYQTIDENVLEKVSVTYEGCKPKILTVMNHYSECAVIETAKNIDSILTEKQKNLILSIQNQIVEDNQYEENIFFLDKEKEIIKEKTNPLFDDEIKDMLLTNPFSIDPDEIQKGKESVQAMVCLYTGCYGATASYIFILDHQNQKSIHPILYTIKEDGTMTKEPDSVAEKILVNNLKEFTQYF